MIRIEFQYSTGNGITLLGFNKEVPHANYYKKVSIDGEEYDTEVVYDFPGHIAIKGTGDFLGKGILFVA